MPSLRSHLFDAGPAEGPRAKLTKRDIPVIRALVRWSGFSLAAVAREYRVSRVTIHDIVRGKTWTHV